METAETDTLCKVAHWAGKKESHRLEFLDAARGIAAIAVVLYHTLGNMGPRLALWMRDREDLGVFGVVVFFFISGFIIPVSLQNKRIGEFWRARCFRLLPAYWVALVLTLLVGALGVPLVPMEYRHFHARIAFLTLAMLPVKPSEHILLGVSWTLTIELYFYVLCSLLKAAGLLTRRLLTAWGAIALYLLMLGIAALHGYAPHHFKGNMGGLLVAAFVGSAFYGVAKDEMSSRVLAPLVPAALATILLGINFEARAALVPVSARAASAAWVLATAFFVMFFCLRYLQFPTLLIWLGRISYSLYLLHTVVFSGVSMLLAPRLGVGAATCIGIAFSVSAADLSYRFVEIPANRLGHRRDAVPMGHRES